MLTNVTVVIATVTVTVIGPLLLSVGRLTGTTCGGAAAEMVTVAGGFEARPVGLGMDKVGMGNALLAGIEFAVEE